MGFGRGILFWLLGVPIPIIILLEPIRKVWIHDEGFATSRFSMMRIMAS
jgi:hypothetical protein